MNRRELMRVSVAGMTGLMAMPSAQGAKTPARTKSIIYLHQFGGPSQFETFDMKPNAPSEIRGSFKPISSKVPGLPVCEMLPQLAKLTDRMTIIRNLQHTMKNHNSAAYYSLTGVPPATDDQRLRDSLELFPAIGSIVDRFSPAPRGIPTYVSYPYVISDGSITPGQHASFLGKVHNPFFFTEDPNQIKFQLPELSLPGDLTVERLDHRRDILKLIDDQTQLIEKSAVAKGIDESYGKAISMLTSPRFKKAFDLSDEKPEVRDRYGRTTYGQSTLLARRLVEAGAKFVTVYLSPSIGGPKGGWDVHGFDNKPMDPILKNWLLPVTDQVVSALIEDLESRGLLDSTLILWMGEFGRTPRINKLAGRDHWPQCFTAMMCGGGVKGGYIHGASDKTGSYPAVGVSRLEDVTATLFAMLGISPDSEIRDKLNRPLPISRGNVLTECIA
jgi:hypothetical protein